MDTKRLLVISLLACGTRAAALPACAAEPPAERFVAAEGRNGVMLEMRGEATVHGAEVKLRNVCRWANSDASFFAPLADLVIARCNPGAAFQSVGLDEVRQTLRDAGVNLAMVRFAGPVGCTVGRNDVQFDEQTATHQWIDAKQGKAPALPAGEIPAPTRFPDSGPATSPSASAGSGIAAVTVDPSIQTLRELLTADAAVKFSLPAEALQITFSPADEKVLALSGPQFKFNIESRRLYNLGDIGWDVRVITDTGGKVVRVGATARAWQKEVVLTRPVSYRQVLRGEELVERRSLVERLPDEPLVTLEQAVGQQASHEIKTGTVLTARMLDAVQLVKQGQFVSITLNQGGISIRTVAKAMDSAAYGQTVRVRNDATGETYDALIIGPQEGTLSPVAQAGRPARAE